jgi:hypothetical protein
MLGLKLDVLTTGCGYDLKRRLGLPPPRAAAEVLHETPEATAALRE